MTNRNAQCTVWGLSALAICLFTIIQSNVALGEPQEGLVAHFPLRSHTNDTSHAKNSSKAVSVKFANDTAVFDGRQSHITVADSDSLDFGTNNFSVSLWVHTDAELDDVLGDLIDKYDPVARKGFNLSIKHHAGATGSQSNYRQLHFGIDDGHQDKEWRDEGRPGNSIFVHSMAVHEDELYVGTVEGQKNANQGYVFRYKGPGEWENLGAPWKSNGVTSMASYNGQLYIGVSRVLLHYSGLEPTIAHHIGGKVFRYENGKWVDLGQLLGIDGVNGMAIFRGKLYVTGFYQPVMYRYEGGTKWTSLGSPDGMRPEALCVYNGALYATGYDEGAVYRFDGEKWSRAGTLGDATQIYGLVVHEGKLLAGSWPAGTVYRYDGDDRWVSTGRLGNSEEVMSLNVYNGKLYAGTLPMAEVYRHDGDANWSSVGRVDFTPDVIYRRAWSMAVYKGRLWSGTLPSGHVRSFEAGVNATYDRELPSGWHHIAATRDTNRLKLYIDGQQVAESREFDPGAFQLSNTAPLRIGSGSHDYFNGRMKDVRLHTRALTPAEVSELAKMQ